MFTPAFLGPASLPLVGREREQAILRDHLGAALTQRGSLVLIGGEAGIGKTTLAESVSQQAEQQGALVFIGRCYDLAETPPYGPWLDLFARYHPTDHLPSLPDVFAQRGMVGDVASESALFHQVQDFLTAITTQRPLVLLLDDLHWSDPASLDLLRFIARDVASSALLILVTYRSDEITRRHPLYQLLPILDREARATRLDLRSLSADAVRALVARYRLPDADHQRLVDHLQARAEGNAFFVTQLLRALEETGALSRGDDCGTLGDLANMQVPMPLKQVIDGRLMRLGEEAQRFLTIAAVIGQEVPLPIWATVAGTDDDALSEVIEQAAAAHLMEEAPDGTQARFVHALIRQVLYESILPSQRRRLHRQVGEALAARSDADPDAIAYHYQQAGDTRAIEWLVKAGERAQRAFASATATERYQAALGLMETYGVHAGERGWLLFRLARLYILRDSHRGITYLEEAARIAEEANNRMLAAHSLFTLGDIRYLGGDIDRGLAEMRAGIDALAALSPEERAQRPPPDIYGALDGGHARSELLVYLATGGRYAEAQTLADTTLAVALAPAAPTGPAWAVLGHGYGGMALVHAALGRLDEARRAFSFEREARRARAGDYNVGLSALNELRFVALPYLADDLVNRERLAAEAEREYMQARSGLPPERGRLPLMAIEGQWPLAKTVAQTVLGVGGNGAYMGNARSVLVLLAREQGDVTLAWQTIRDALPAGPIMVPGNTPLYLDSLVLQRLATLLATDAGDLPTARAWLEAHDRWLNWSGAVLGQSEGHALWAQYHRAIGNIARAYDAATSALAHATDPRQPLALLAAHRLLGELDTDAGRFDDAALHLDTALTLADACAAPYERALSLLALAELRAAMKSKTDVITLLDAIRAICISLGAKPALARADTLAIRLATVKDAPPSYPAGLSAREVEVLQLMATGRTNRDIANALFLSEHTVRVHVRNILTKTDAANRTEAATFALRHGLA